MSNDYDKIFKENIGELFLALSKKYFNVEIKQSVEIKDKLQTTLEKEADFLRKVVTPQGKQLIVHLEFQTTDEKHMVYRMQEYYAILQKKYQLPIIQFVIYVGDKPPKMRSQLDKREIFTGFELMNMKEVDYEQLIASDIPEEVILAVLGNFNQTTSAEVLQQIIAKLNKLSGSPISLNKYIRQLLIFARLRNLTEETEKQLNTMAFTYDIEKDSLYQRGLKKGEEKGVEKGITQIALKMKEEGVAVEEISKFTGLSIQQINDLK